MSGSFSIARNYLGKSVIVVIDRPIGSKHPKHNFEYLANYGYLEGVMAPDGEELDAYFLGINTPIEQSEGKVIAIIHRIEDDDDKLIVVPTHVELTDEEIERAVEFQEKWFKHEIVR